MRYPKFTAARSHLIPFTALMLATALGGCVGYTGYPSSGYGYSYPNSNGYYGSYPSTYGYNYPAAYPRTYTNSINYRPLYSSDYNSSFNTYENGGGGH
jgi:hypothetical protein